MRIIGLQRLSKDDIEKKSQQLLLYYNPNFLSNLHPTPLRNIADFLSNEHDIIFDYNANLGFNSNGNRILGCFSTRKERKIRIDASIEDNISKFNFVLAHELGHLALHRNVLFEDTDEEYLEDVEYDFDGKKKLITDIDWMEWQANYYASCILLPKDIFHLGLQMAREKIGLPRNGKVFLDEQKCNVSDFYNTLAILSDYFHVSKSVIEYRLRDFDLIEERKTWKHASEVLREMEFNINNHT